MLIQSLFDLAHAVPRMDNSLFFMFTITKILTSMLHVLQMGKITNSQKEVCPLKVCSFFFIIIISKFENIKGSLSFVFSCVQEAYMKKNLSIVVSKQFFGT